MDVHDPPREPVEERGRKDPHVAGQHDDLGAVLVEEVRGLGGVGRGDHRDAGPLGPADSGRLGPARDDAGDVDVGGVDQRLEIRALARDEDADLQRRVTPSPSITLPATNPGVPPRSSAVSATSTDSGTTTQAKPRPMLKTRHISSFSTPSEASQPNTGWRSHAPVSISAARPAGNWRARLPGMPPPVMCAMPRTSTVRVSSAIARA